MRPEPSTEQRELQAAAREVLSREVDPDKLLRWESDATGFDPALGRTVADLGWIALGLPAAAGGGGADLVDVASLVEECARGLLPRPLLGAIRSANVLADIAPDDPLLGPIGRGESRLAVAIDEIRDRDPGRFSTRLGGSPAARIVSGGKAYVPDAAEAEFHLVASRAASQPVFVVVDRRSAGVSLQPLRTFGGDRQAHVHYRDAAVVREIASARGGADVLDRVWRVQTALALAEMTGGMGAVLDMTVEYVKQREQFGQKIAIFQAVRHQVADMGTTHTAARHLAWQAITRIASGRERDMEMTSAVAWVGQAFKRICWAAHHLHGGAGFVVEHRLRFHSERAQSLCVRYTPEAPALREIAAALLDAPV